MSENDDDTDVCPIAPTEPPAAAPEQPRMCPAWRCCSTEGHAGEHDYVCGGCLHPKSLCLC